MIIRGETKFCPGCPFTGDFVGQVTPKSVRKEYYGQQIMLTDNDELDSEHIQVRLDEVFDDPLVFEELQSRIVQRIAECVGVVRKRSSTTKEEYIRCPALSGIYVMQKLVQSVKE